MHKTIIFGLGKTGLSYLDYFQKRNIPVTAIDTRAVPPAINQVRQQFPHTTLHCGKIPEQLMQRADQIILSPGISRQHEWLRDCLPENIIGDIEIFARESTMPTVAITGTNGKSTVTDCLDFIAQYCGIHAAVGGNIGVPALSLLDQTNACCAILELSSYQLESTFSLKPKVATILNITPDHMDRYASFDDYVHAKQRVYHNCETAIHNREDPLTKPVDTVPQQISCGLNTPGEKQFGIRPLQNKYFICYGEQALLATDQLQLPGRMNWYNAQVALAIGKNLGWPMDKMCEALSQYSGLPHRCQFVKTINGVKWYNDSKGTNVGATLSAIASFQDCTGQLIVLVGGDAKAADFTPLNHIDPKQLNTLILYGRDADFIQSQLQSHIPHMRVHDLENAVDTAHRVATQNDIVLLSPACASFDSYTDFNARGEAFMALVQAL